MASINNLGRIRLLRIGVLLLANLSGLARAICYYPDGSVANSDVPCWDNQSDATCCAPGFVCLSNHMCQALNEYGDRDPNSIHRGSCTDQEFKSSQCPTFCATENDILDGGNQVANCPNSPDTYYCVRPNGNDDPSCDDPRSVVSIPGKPTVITTIGVSETSSSESSTHSDKPTTSDAPASTQASDPPTMDSSKSNDAAPSSTETTSGSDTSSGDNNADSGGSSLVAALSRLGIMAAMAVMLV